jgi:sigma-B regulation protein RsbU (phosphoserine phosphatase)
LSDNVRSEDFADLYETAPCGYLSLTPDARICNVNRTLAGWIGRRQDEILGRPVHDFLSFGGRIAFETHLAPLLRMQGHVHEIALDLVTADGTKVPTLANAAEKRDSSGTHLFTRLTLLKAVDRRSYERSLVDARERAEADSAAEREASLLRDQFVAVLGHDLRNPLAAIQAGITMLAKREQLTATGKMIVDEMRGSVGRAMELIDDVLDLARGRLGNGIRVTCRSAALEPRLRQVVAEVRAFAKDHVIEGRFDIRDPVFCDPQRLAQLGANLLSNAVTHGAREEPVVFEAQTTGNELRIAVSNGGAPIPENARDQLFEPFFRGAVRPSGNGLGLGLYIANEIAKAHGGGIAVSSDEKQTRFTFSMPLASEGDPGSQ